MKKLLVEVVLLYYDYPQVFVGRDEVDSRYLCMITDDGELGPNFACMPVSRRRISELTSGRLDLRDAFEQPEVAEFYVAQFSQSADASLTMNNADYSEMPRHFLPAPGVIFEDYDEVSLTAAELNSTVSFVSLEVPESSDSTRIRSSTLAGFLNIFQAMVRNFGRVAARAAKKPLKRGDDSYSADVFGFAMGSFTIKFRSSHPSDLVGESPTLSAAMAQLNRFLAVSDDPDKAIAFLQSVRGHTASSLIKMLEFLLQHSSAIRVNWANPSMTSSQGAQMPLHAIKTLVEICRQRSDLSVEEVVIRGRVSKADVDAASWKIESDDDHEVYSGEISPGSGINLNGITITDALYEFTCQEVAEVVPATGQERKKLLLLSIKKL
jgi:hypothetical protein